MVHPGTEDLLDLDPGLRDGRGEADQREGRRGEAELGAQVRVHARRWAGSVSRFASARDGYASGPTDAFPETLNPAPTQVGPC